MLKKILIIMILTVSLFASQEFILKDGERIVGETICEGKGRLVVKSGSSVVAIFKKSIESFNGVRIAGAREFMLGDSLILKNKNEIFFVVDTEDNARVKLRQVLEGGGEILLGELSGSSGDTLKFYATDGKFYESVEYTRAGTYKYYWNGAIFELKNKCEKFSRAEISLQGFPGEEVPVLRGEENKFKKDGD